MEENIRLPAGGGTGADPAVGLPAAQVGRALGFLVASAVRPSPSGLPPTRPYP
jgi:hypothetical protein